MSEVEELLIVLAAHERGLKSVGYNSIAANVARAAALLRTQQQRIEEQSWRAIESAPKDGAQFIAFENGDIYRCAWMIDDTDEGPPDQGWFDFSNASFENPTHWMPLPPPPAISSPRSAE